MPLIGNLHSFYKYPKNVDLLLKWRKQYGDVFTYWFGGIPVISINDYDTLVETVQKDGTTYEDRPEMKEFIEVFKGE